LLNGKKVPGRPTQAPVLAYTYVSWQVQASCSSLHHTADQTYHVRTMQMPQKLQFYAV